jgi:hypothetical protein
MPFVFCVRSRLEMGSTGENRAVQNKSQHILYIGIIKGYTRGVPGLQLQPLRSIITDSTDAPAHAASEGVFGGGGLGYLAVVPVPEAGRTRARRDRDLGSSGRCRWHWQIHCKFVTQPHGGKVWPEVKLIVLLL